MEWLKQWNSSLLEGCHDGAPASRRYRLARQRVDAWQDLERALLARDLDNVHALAAHPHLAGYPPVLRRQQELDGLLQLGKELAQVDAIIADGNVAAFRASDIHYLTVNEARFRRHQERLVRLWQSWLRGEGRLQALERPCAVNRAENTVTIRWAWKHTELISYCEVAVDGKAFASKRKAAGLMTYRLCPADYRPVTGLTISLAGLPFRLYLTVWPVVDLGWLQVEGEPLQLGPLVVSGPLRR